MCSVMSPFFSCGLTWPYLPFRKERPLRNLEVSQCPSCYLIPWSNIPPGAKCALSSCYTPCSDINSSLSLPLDIPLFSSPVLPHARCFHSLHFLKLFPKDSTVPDTHKTFCYSSCHSISIHLWLLGLIPHGKTLISWNWSRIIPHRERACCKPQPVIGCK